MEELVVGARQAICFRTCGTIAPSRFLCFAKSKSNLRLIDSEALVDLVLAHYEQFDSKYKGVLPLQRVYVPEPIPDDEVDE